MNKSHKQQIEDFERWLKSTISGAEADCAKLPNFASEFLHDMIMIFLGMQRGLYALVQDSVHRRELESLFDSYFKEAEATKSRILKEIEQAKNGAAA